MENAVEKIYCCDNNNTVPAWTLWGNNNGGFFGNNNNGLWFLFLLLLGGRGWNGWGNGNNGINTEFSLLQDQAQQNQNTTLLREAIRDNYGAIQQLAQNLNCDFNTLNSCCCDLKQAIATIGGQIGYSKEAVINAVNMGDCNVIQALKDCCCATQKAILEQGYQNQLATCQQTNELRGGQRDLGVAISQGFAQSSFQNQQNTCQIIQAINASQQKTADLLTSHWSDEQAREIQDLKNENSQLKQTQYLAKLIQGGGNCGCGNGIGY